MWIIYNVQNVWTPYNSLFFLPHSYKLPIFLSTEYTPFLPLKLIHSFSPQNFILVHSLSSSQLHTHMYTSRLLLIFIHPPASSKLHTTPVFLTTSFIPYLPLHFIQSLSSYPFHTLHSSFSTSYTTNLFHSQSSSQLRTFRVFIPTTYCTTSLLPP